MIKTIQDTEGRNHDTHEAIMNMTTNSIAKGYEDIPIDNVGVAELCRRIKRKVIYTQRRHLKSKITDMEVKQAILQGATRKAPGVEGIPIEFYRWEWKIIKTEMLEVYEYNVMFSEEYVTKEQARGIIVCTQKNQRQRR
jgi:hypothetical protein